MLPQWFSARCLAVLLLASGAAAQTGQRVPEPTRADILRGEYGRYRANNDLLSYHLDIRVDPEKKWIGGKNTIRFKMLKDASRIQLDLHEALNIDKILLADTTLQYTRDGRPDSVDCPDPLRAARPY